MLEKFGLGIVVTFILALLAPDASGSPRPSGSPPSSSSGSVGAPVAGKHEPAAGGAVCQYKKYDGVYYFGMLLTVAKDVPSLDTCLSVCSKYAAKICRSVNYLSNTKKCELMSDVLDIKNANALRDNAEAKADSTYAIPTSCK